jgi:hypothetical protein
VRLLGLRGLIVLLAHWASPSPLRREAVARDNPPLPRGAQCCVRRQNLGDLWQLKWTPVWGRYLLRDETIGCTGLRADPPATAVTYRGVLSLPGCRRRGCRLPPSQRSWPFGASRHRRPPAASFIIYLLSQRSGMSERGTRLAKIRGDGLPVVA